MMSPEGHFSVIIIHLYHMFFCFSVKCIDDEGEICLVKDVARLLHLLHIQVCMGTCLDKQKLSA